MLLTASFAPAVGGVETLLYQTSRRMAEPPVVLAPAPAGAPDLPVTPVQLSTASRAAYRPLWSLHPSLHYLSAFWVPAVRALAAWRPAVILAGHVYLAPLAWLLARRTHRPFVVYTYGQEVWLRGRRVGQWHLDRLLRGHALASADRVLAPGHFTAGLVEDWGVKPDRILRVPFGAEPRPIAARPDGTAAASTARPARLLSVARLIPRKGIDTVIAALARLDPAVEYHVVGSGPDEARLRTLAAARGVADRVHFLGRVDDAQLAQEYQHCTLFVLPARRTPDGELEGYGLVYFEAAAWGRAVVAGRSGGEVDAVVDGQTGILVDGESVDQLARAIGGLLADPPRCQRLGAAGHARVIASHNWQSAAATVDAVLEQLA